MQDMVMCFVSRILFPIHMNKQYHRCGPFIVKMTHQTDLLN